MKIEILTTDLLKVHESLPEELIKISSWSDNFTFTGSYILVGNSSMAFTHDEYSKIKNTKRRYFIEGKRIEFSNYIIVPPVYFENQSLIESFFIKEGIPLRLIDFKDLKDFILNPTNSITQIKKYEKDLSIFEELFNIFMYGKSDSTKYVYEEVSLMNTGRLEYVLNKFNYDEIHISAREAYFESRYYHASKFITENNIKIKRTYSNHTLDEDSHRGGYSSDETTKQYLCEGKSLFYINYRSGSRLVTYGTGRDFREHFSICSWDHQPIGRIDIRELFEMCKNNYRSENDRNTI